MLGWLLNLGFAAGETVINIAKTFGIRGTISDSGESVSGNMLGDGISMNGMMRSGSGAIGVLSDSGISIGNDMNGSGISVNGVF